jgi:hypothetical protein
MLEHHLAASVDPKTAGLPYYVEITRGMRVIVTWNLTVQADLAKGVQGMIEEILLNPCEPSVPCGVWLPIALTSRICHDTQY